MQKFKTWKDLDAMHEDGIKTKADLARTMKLEEKCRAFDYALPQCWIDNIVKETILQYDVVLPTTFWVYEEGSIFGRPVSGLEFVQQEIDKEREGNYGI